jgi:hypothetical protein
MTRSEIERERMLSLDIAREWILRAKLGEFPDGQLMTLADISAFVRQGRYLQWNALSRYRSQMRKLNAQGRAA